jgi:hypothetical protein
MTGKYVAAKGRLGSDVQSSREYLATTRPVHAGRSLPGNTREIWPTPVGDGQKRTTGGLGSRRWFEGRVLEVARPGGRYDVVSDELN